MFGTIGVSKQIWEIEKAPVRLNSGSSRKNPNDGPPSPAEDDGANIEPVRGAKDLASALHQVELGKDPAKSKFIPDEAETGSRVLGLK